MLKTCLLSDEKDTPANNNSPAKEKLPISRMDSNVGEASTPAFFVDPKKDIQNKNDDRKVVICNNNREDQRDVERSQQEQKHKLENIVTENTTPDPKKPKNSTQEKHQDQNIPKNIKIDKENDATSTIEDPQFYSALSHQNDSKDKDKIIEVAAEVKIIEDKTKKSKSRPASMSTPQGGSIFDLKENFDNNKENQRPQELKASASIFESKKKKSSSGDKKKSIKISESSHSLVGNNN